MFELMIGALDDSNFVIPEEMLELDDFQERNLPDRFAHIDNLHIGRLLRVEQTDDCEAFYTLRINQTLEGAVLDSVQVCGVEWNSGSDIWKTVDLSERRERAIELGDHYRGYTDYSCSTGQDNTCILEPYFHSYAEYVISWGAQADRMSFEPIFSDSDPLLQHLLSRDDASE